MVEEKEVVKEKETEIQPKSTDGKTLEGKEKEKSQTVPYDRFKEVNDERNAFKAKAEALDALWADPDFQEFLKAKEGGGEGKTKTKEEVEEDLDKPLTLREARQLFKKDLEQGIKDALKPRDMEKEKEDLEVAIKEVKAMEEDDKNFPYFKPFGYSDETDEVRKEMIRLMEQEGVKNMKTAYKTATADLRVRDIEKQHKEQLESQRFGKVRSRSTVALRGEGPKIYKGGPREAAEDAADKLNF